jgi:hypothetical protein
MADFEQAANHILLSVNPIKQQTRNIGSLASEITRRNIRNRGCNRIQRGGRSQTQYRDGRGGGGGRGSVRGRHQNSCGHNLTGGRLSVGYYTPKEWLELTPDQRTRIMHNRSASEDLTQTASTGTRRQIAVIDIDSSTNIKDAVSALTLPTASQPMNTTNGNAGNQFGHQARSIGVIKSGSRQTTSTRKVAAITIDDMAGHISTVDLDSHADTCLLGANFKVISYTEKEV